MKKFIYLAGSHKDKSNWRKTFQKKLDACFKGKVQGIDPFVRNIDESKSEAIVGHDLFCIKNCDFLLANLVGSGFSFGTVQEIVLAKYWNKGVVIVADEKSGIRLEKGRIHSFALNFADCITDNYDSAINWISEFLQGKARVKTFEDTLKAEKKYVEEILPKDKITREIFKS